MSEKGPLEDLSEPDEALSSADEMSEGPGMVDEMWDAVTDGVFDNLHFDTFFVILFVSMVRPKCLAANLVLLCRCLHVCTPAFGSHMRAGVVLQLLFFFCFILPWTIDKIENMSKFELTPEMQEELKELMAKVRMHSAVPIM